MEQRASGRQADALPQRSVVNVKRLQQASRKLDVIPIEPEAGRYMVASASHTGAHYAVSLHPELPEGHCSCLWGQHGGVNCKHVLAALRAHYAERGAVSFWRGSAEARRQHRQIVIGDSLYLTLRPH